MKPSQANYTPVMAHFYWLAGAAISMPTSVLLFIDGTVVSNGYGRRGRPIDW